jgi:hypothetical protein
LPRSYPVDDASLADVRDVIALLQLPGLQARKRVLGAGERCRMPVISIGSTRTDKTCPMLSIICPMFENICPMLSNTSPMFENICPMF